MKILLLSAYHAASHAYWAEGLQRELADIEWTVLTLPPRHFRWRARGNSLSWALLQRDVLEHDYDLLLATSMVDLSALRGLVPKLATLPSVVYFHENQFDYPQSEADRHSAVELQMLNIYTALAADRVLFNSRYNLNTFIDGAVALLRKLPDFNPHEALEATLRERSTVLPVPLAANCFMAAPRAASDRLHVLWNHRWEYDKGPAQLLAAAAEWQRRQLPVTLHVVGQRFRQAPPEFEQLRKLLSAGGSVRLGEFGFIAERQRYRQLLTQCDVVLSTSLHDFQGLAVLEAVAARCRPLLPARLCYPECFGSEYLYASHPDDTEAEASALADAVATLCQRRASGDWPAAPSVEWLGWPALAAQYRACLAPQSCISDLKSVE